MSKLLTSSQTSTLVSARRRAKRRAINVRAHRREFYALSGPYLRRLAQWDALELQVLRLCRHVDRHGSRPMDKKSAWKLITLLEDTFEINTGGQ